MSRLANLVRHPRRTLAVLATVTTAVGVTVASGADFTASSANPANTFSTGTLTMSNSRADAAILTASGLRPGQSQEGTVDIENSGSLSGVFTLARGTVDQHRLDQPARRQAQRRHRGLRHVHGRRHTRVWRRRRRQQVHRHDRRHGHRRPSVAGLGTYGGGDKHRYRFRVTLDSSAGNAYQGDSSTTEFTWAAA